MANPSEHGGNDFGTFVKKGLGARNFGFRRGYEGSYLVFKNVVDGIMGLGYRTPSFVVDAYGPVEVGIFLVELEQGVEPVILIVIDAIG